MQLAEELESQLLVFICRMYAEALVTFPKAQRVYHTLSSPWQRPHGRSQGGQTGGPCWWRSFGADHDGPSPGQTGLGLQPAVYQRYHRKNSAGGRAAVRSDRELAEVSSRSSQSSPGFWRAARGRSRAAGFMGHTEPEPHSPGSQPPPVSGRWWWGRWFQWGSLRRYVSRERWLP